jgi:hypothetical protein
MAGVREITASLQVPTKARARLHLDRKGPEDALNREPGGILNRKRVQRFGVTDAGLVRELADL